MVKEREKSSLMTFFVREMRKTSSSVRSIPGAPTHVTTQKMQVSDVKVNS